MAMPQLVCDDVLHWAETYDGPPFHALLCDAPYHLQDKGIKLGRGLPGGKGLRVSGTGTGFMGKSWDGGDIAFRPDTWRALAQHLLPGAFGMTFGSSRGWHRLACAIEDAGMVIRPSIFMLGWATGQGWPKATRIDTAVDQAAGVDRAYVGEGPYAGRKPRADHDRQGLTYADDTYVRPAGQPLFAPATDLAKTWAGHRYGGQALKPSLEPVIVWQKPYHGRPVDSITATGAGALWIEESRVGIPIADVLGNSGGKRWPPNLALVHLPECKPRGTQKIPGNGRPHCEGNVYEKTDLVYGSYKAEPYKSRNTAPDGTETVQTYDCAPECPVAAFDRQAGERTTGARAGGGLKFGGSAYAHDATSLQMESFASVNGGDTGPASR